MTVHDPQPQRRDQGYKSRYASCPCGWTAEANSWDDARERCAEHNVVVVARLVLPNLYEECYDPDLMEFGPGPCDRCRLRDALAALDAARPAGARKLAGDAA